MGNRHDDASCKRLGAVAMTYAVGIRHETNTSFRAQNLMLCRVMSQDNVNIHFCRSFTLLAAP